MKLLTYTKMNTYQNNVINQKRENEDCHHANIRKLLDSNIKLPNISNPIEYLILANSVVCSE